MAKIIRPAKLETPTRLKDALVARSEARGELKAVALNLDSDVVEEAEVEAHFLI